MKFKKTLYINHKKLKRHTSKAMFLVLPIAMLIALSIVVSSQVLNFENAADESIFGTIEEQSTLLIVEKPVVEFVPGVPRSESTTDTQYSEVDLTIISEIENVESAVLNSALPLSNINTSDLLEDKDIKITKLIGLDSNIASLYTEDEFAYIEGEPVPIVLNSSSFIETYEDWGDSTEFTLDFRELRESGVDITSLTPVKTKVIDYSKDDLIGKVFTLEVGGLKEVETYTSTRETGVITMSQLSSDEITELENIREESISKYWDYAQVSTPITQEFIVVGIIEDISDSSTYIPLEYSDILMKEYFSQQLSAQIDNEIPLEDLNSTYLGLTYDGLDLAQGSGSSPSTGGSSGGMGSLIGSNTSSDGYQISGLVINLSEDGTETVLGLNTDLDVYNQSVKYGDTISIKVDTIYNRQQVIDDLNDLGYAYQDLSDLEVFDTVQESLNSITFGLMVSFVILTIVIILLTMSKFVSDSRREIGIFRAIGVTKNGIIKLFVTQSMLYVLVGYMIGVLLGLVFNVMASSLMSNWFTTFIDSTLGESYGVVNSIDSSFFISIDLNSLIIFTAVMFIISLLVSLVPAVKASNISPVEAIRGE